MPAHFKRVQKTCIICGVVFENTPSRIKEQVTCRSEACKKAIKFGQHNPFYGKQHTDDSKAKVSKAKRKPRVEIPCTCGCGEMVIVEQWRTKRNKTNVFFVNREHLNEWVQGENHWNYRGGNIYYGDGWLKLARAVRERDKVCQECGKTPQENGRELDVHHKIPARISRDNSMENLVALCMTCHHKINTFEQYDYPTKVSKYRTCLLCNKLFIPAPFQKFCSDKCHRKRTRQWEKKHIDTHPEAYRKRRERIARWQKANKDRVNASHQQTRLRRRSEHSQ